MADEQQNLITTKQYAEQIGRNASVIRGAVVRNGIVPVGTIKVAQKSSAFLYKTEDLMGIKLRRKSHAKEVTNG